MLHESKKLLHDALMAGGHALQFVEGKSQEDYENDIFLRSAVERQLFIVGEAISQIARVDRASFDELPKSRKLVGFRNLLAHGYGSIDDKRVWAMLSEELPGTLEQVTRLLGDEQ